MIWDYSDYQINSIIIKATNCCNLRCRYCYVKGKNTGTIRHIDYNLVEKIINDYFSYCENHNIGEDLYIVWHGGEPLFCGIKFFREVIDIEKKIIHNKPARHIYNSIQTNGTLLTEEFINILQANKFGIGISIDGTEDDHDINRIFPNGMGTSKIIQKGIANLHKYGINFSCICVINNYAIKKAKKYYLYFKNIGVNEVDFIPSFFQDSKFNLTTEEYAEFMKSLFDEYFNDDNKTFSIRVFDDILRSFLQSKGQYYGSIGCEFAGRCGENISISVDGDVYPCDCLANIEKLKLGNIRKQTIEDIIRGDTFKFFVHNVNNEPEECRKCEVFNICHGGCFNRRISDFNLNRLQKDIYCDTRKDIIEYVCNKCHSRLLQNIKFNN